MTNSQPSVKAQAPSTFEQQEVEIDRMMAAAADRDLAEPWQAVKAALAEVHTITPAQALAFNSALHRALRRQGHDPEERAYC